MGKCVVPSRLVAGDTAAVHLVLSAAGGSSGTPEARGLLPAPLWAISPLTEEGCQDPLTQYYITTVTGQGTKNSKTWWPRAPVSVAAACGTSEQVSPSLNTRLLVYRISVTLSFHPRAVGSSTDKAQRASAATAIEPQSLGLGAPQLFAKASGLPTWLEPYLGYQDMG